MVLAVPGPLFSSSTETVPRFHQGFLTRVAVEPTPRGLRFTFGLRKIPLGEHQVAGGMDCKDPLCTQCADQVSIDGVSVDAILSACLDAGVLVPATEEGFHAFPRPRGHKEVDLLPMEYQATLRFPTRVRPKILLARWERHPAPEKYLIPDVQIHAPARGEGVYLGDRRVSIALQEEERETPCALVILQASWLLTALTHLGILLPSGCDEDADGHCLFLVRLPHGFQPVCVC